MSKRKYTVDGNTFKFETVETSKREYMDCYNLCRDQDQHTKVDGCILAADINDNEESELDEVYYDAVVQSMKEISIELQQCRYGNKSATATLLAIQIIVDEAGF